MQKFIFCFFFLISISTFSQEEIDLNEVVFQATEEEKIYQEEINARVARQAPTLTGSITDVLKTLPYVSVNTELSSQYMVRGGNYDENLIYINGVEIFKPQLVRSGQQEGLSLIHPKMVALINFMPGGWEAQWGDKLSSVLDVIYKNPNQKFAEISGGLLGGDITAGLPFKGGSLLVSGRYLNRNLILNTLDENTDFNPLAYDFQALLNYKISKRLKIFWLGNYNFNEFQSIPKSRQTQFGTLQHPINVYTYYQGREQEQFKSKFSHLNLNFQLTPRWDLNLGLTMTHTQEKEYYDVLSAYYIRTTDEESNATATRDIGGQIDYGRNDLDAFIFGIQHKGNFEINKNQKLTWGFEIQKEDLKDRLNEWQMIDSAGYSLKGFEDYSSFQIQAQNPHLEVNYAMQGTNQIQSIRYTSFLQYNTKFFWHNAKVLLNAGVRTGYWDFNQEINISPRFQMAIKPDWVTSQLFRLAVGKYVQPAFYKEMRKLDGSLNSKIKAQKSYHFLAGHDFEFFIGDRPFKLSTDLYYKKLQDLVPYYLDNVRIRYTGENESKGFAYGVDTRLYGELIPGADSWLSLSYGRTREKWNQQTWIDRPTDPRFKISLFFQDSMPLFPSFKVNMNLIYATGLPNGAPPLTNPYDFQRRLPDYKRVDVGLKKIIIQNRKKNHKLVKQMEVGVDIFNIFNIQNVISNQWLRDVQSRNIYGVPHRLTGRFFNANFYIKF